MPARVKASGIVPASYTSNNSDPAGEMKLDELLASLDVRTDGDLKVEITP